MITDKDERTFTVSKYANELPQAVHKAYENIIENIGDFVKYDWGMDRVQVYPLIHKFDELIKREGGFELDDRTLRHANGIGNNHEWDIVDKELVKVGSFYCNSNMYSSVYTGVEVNGKIIERYCLSPRGVRDK